MVPANQVPVAAGTSRPAGAVPDPTGDGRRTGGQFRHPDLDAGITGYLAGPG